MFLKCIVAGLALIALAQAAENRLATETSPYLLLHAKNPVNWYPWGKEALDRARAEQKPVFLSIGYYTCHWCHVMERESFSNPEIAAVLNQSFIAIKVDREERPDIDRLYIAYLMSQNGTAGWPANVFLTPDLKPFAGGVYFPPDTLKKLLLKIAGDWSKDREGVTRNAGRAAKELTASVNEARASSVKLQSSLLDKAFHQIASGYDRENGGFGGAPKFPRPSGLDFLLRTYARTGNRAAVDMALRTLRAMARGGIHDHVGGGFHRYSTDVKWRIPHYEKMLYDQAQLAVLYTQAWQITSEPIYAAAARDTLDFTLRELHLAEGGFGSALDADSRLAANKDEIAEGAFYQWTAAEIEAAAGKTDGGLFSFIYGMEPGMKAGVLYQRRGADEAGKKFGLNLQQITASIAKARTALLEARDRRPRPPLDDKVVTAWNALAISALARASQVFDEPRYLTAAEEAAAFLETHSYDAASGRLWRSYRAGKASMPAVLDDYTDLIAGLIDLYQAGFNLRRLNWAAALQKTQDELFEDTAAGGYFDATASDATLLARTREAYDGAEPSPNSTAAMNLLRLAHMTGRAEWRDKAARTLAAFGGRLTVNPDQMPALASALDFSLAPARHIVIAGDPKADDTREMLRVVNTRYLPNMVLLLADGGAAQAQLATGLPFLEGVTRIRGKATAYICEDLLCKLPTTDPKIAAGLLDAR